MAVEQYANLAQDQLNGGINSGVTSLVLNDASEFPATGNFRILIDSELLICTARSGNTLTVTRGAESTVAASHSNGATVTLVATAGSIVAVGSAIHRRDTYANRPAAGTEGRLFLPSNAPTIDRDSGSLWTPHGPVFPLVEPVDGDFSWVNQGGASVDATKGGIYLLAPANGGGESIRARVQSAPATPYTVTVMLLGLAVPADYYAFGVLWRQSSDGKIITIQQSFNVVPLFACNKYTNETTYAGSQYFSYTWSNFAGHARFWRLADDGVNRIVSISNDGQHFQEIHSVGRTDFLTADQIGFFANSVNASYPCSATLLSWEEA